MNFFHKPNLEESWKVSAMNKIFLSEIGEILFSLYPVISFLNKAKPPKNIYLHIELCRRLLSDCQFNKLSQLSQRPAISLV